MVARRCKKDIDIAMWQEAAPARLSMLIDIICRMGTEAQACILRPSLEMARDHMIENYDAVCCGARAGSWKRGHIPHLGFCKPG